MPNTGLVAGVWRAVGVWYVKAEMGNGGRGFGSAVGSFGCGTDYWSCAVRTTDVCRRVCVGVTAAEGICRLCNVYVSL